MVVKPVNNSVSRMIHGSWKAGGECVECHLARGSLSVNVRRFQCAEYNTSLPVFSILTSWFNLTLSTRIRQSVQQGCLQTGIGGWAISYEGHHSRRASQSHPPSHGRSMFIMLSTAKKKLLETDCSCRRTSHHFKTTVFCTLSVRNLLGLAVINFVSYSPDYV